MNPEKSPTNQLMAKITTMCCPCFRIPRGRSIWATYEYTLLPMWLLDSEH
jgi:hypothetical protein